MPPSWSLTIRLDWTRTLRHPAHEEVGRRFFEVMEGGVVFDYELQDGKSAGAVVLNWLS